MATQLTCVTTWCLYCNLKYAIEVSQQRASVYLGTVGPYAYFPNHGQNLIGEDSEKEMILLDMSERYFWLE